MSKIEKMIEFNKIIGRKVFLCTSLSLHNFTFPF